MSKEIRLTDENGMTLYPECLETSYEVTKFAGGLMIEHFKKTGVAFNNESLKNIEDEFPEPFISSPQVFVSLPNTGNTSYIFRCGITAIDNTKYSLVAATYDANPVTVTNRQFNILAIGRWK